MAIIFLGILLDAANMELHLPQDKLEALLELLGNWFKRKKRTTKKELLSLISKLSFAAKVVPAERLFLRQLIDLSTARQYFQVLTDHKSLTFVLNTYSDHHSPQRAHQLDYISVHLHHQALSLLGQCSC